MSVKHLNWAWDQQVKNPTTKLILMKLADGADESNRSWYSHKTLAIKCETSISSVRRHLSYLKKLNLIRIEHRIRTEGIMKGSQTSNYYYINIDTPVQNEHPPCSPVNTPPVHSYEQRTINKEPLKEHIYINEEKMNKVISETKVINVRPEDIMFDEWWENVPFETNKNACKYLYRKALQRAEHKDLCKSVRDYYDYCINSDKKRTYWIRPHNWLKGEYWLQNINDEEKKPSEIGLIKAKKEEYGHYYAWRKRVEDWLADGFWLERIWGERPDNIKTSVPAELLKEFKIGKYKQCSSTKVS